MTTTAHEQTVFAYDITVRQQTTGKYVSNS
jgi:hypothetical protein